MSIEIVLATKNVGKAEQIAEIFRGSRVSIRTLTDAGIEGEAVEDGATLEENAVKKAIFAWNRLATKGWTMADDTGIFIRALNGRPGTHSARWAGDVSTEEITRQTLQQMEGKTDRFAVFRAVVALVSPVREICCFQGSVRGTVLHAPRALRLGMPYSPIFVPEGSKLAWSEMSIELENSLSHRGKAFRLARAFLEGRA